MATITINSTVADCISITGIVKELCDKFDILNIKVPMSIKSICELAHINPNKGRFILDDCVAHGLLNKEIIVDKNARYKRYTYNVTDRGLKAIVDKTF